MHVFSCAYYQYSAIKIFIGFATAKLQKMMTTITTLKILKHGSEAATASAKLLRFQNSLK